MRVHDELDAMETVEASRMEEARRLLIEWEAYVRLMVDAGIIAAPGRLLGKTVGFLDSTAC